MDNIKSKAIELAMESFEKEDIGLGAEYLLEAYYESNKSKEILGYFDEIFFKPNLEELERIYNLNSEKIKKELKKETLEFKDLPYYIIPITEEIIYIYDKDSNDIISKDFTKEQVNIINLCINEELMLEEDINGYLNILMKNQNANMILKDIIYLFIKYEKYDDIFVFYKSEFCGSSEKNKEKEKSFILFLENELKNKDYARKEIIKRFSNYLGRDTTYIFLNKIRFLFLENQELDNWDIINIKEINFKEDFDICGEFIYYLIKKEIDIGDIIAKLNNENLIRFIKYISDNFEDFPEVIKKYLEIYPNYRKLNDIIFTNVLRNVNTIKNTNISEEIKFRSKKLHVGCGRNILEGWINLDLMPLSGVDVVADLDDCKNKPLPLSDNSIEEFYVSHVIEHINNPLPMMQELHRVALPNAKAVFRCPYGSTDEAFEDPTHVKQYFLNSFGYFSQPFYWRADYGYRGDWLTEKIILVVDQNRYKGKSSKKILEEINLYRNVVIEMIVELRAVKPIRDTKMELQVQPKIEISLA